MKTPEPFNLYDYGKKDQYIRIARLHLLHFGGILLLGALPRRLSLAHGSHIVVRGTQQPSQRAGMGRIHHLVCVDNMLLHLRNDVQHHGIPHRLSLLVSLIDARSRLNIQIRQDSIAGKIAMPAK